MAKHDDPKAKVEQIQLSPGDPLTANNAPDRRWAWLEVNLEAIRRNLQRFRKHIGPDVLIMAVVKADGYGHGAVEVARTALATGAKFLGVSNVDEGITLRKAGIIAPILVLSQPPESTIDLILHYQLTPAVQTAEFALELGESAASQDRVTPFHLKIDTGMNRVGVHYADAPDLLRTIDFHRGLKLQGVFTHFATADEVETFEFSRQYERFIKALDEMRYLGINPGIVHAANTAATIRYKHAHFDMVRVGIGMYGLHPSAVTRSLIELYPAMSVYARVTMVKPVSIGEGVSYGMRYRSPGNVLIGTLPLGYADGLARELSGKIDVLVRGRRLHQVGTICMDMMMFEADQRSSAKNPPIVPVVGDEAVIVGIDGKEQISIDDLAKVLGTINYDVACRLGMRLERLYVE
ncbi:MAG: alanine racemase [Coriobacteriales bacterium]|nr:alanine racemase [Coriobacteriales bacterium]